MDRLSMRAGLPWLALAGVLACLLAAPPVAAAEPGHIEVQGPPGIQVFLDDKLMGVTSEALGGLLIQDVPAGMHTITTVKKGFRSQVTRVQVAPGQVLVHKVARFVPTVEVKEDGRSSEGALNRKVGCLAIVTLPVKALLDIPTAGVEKYEKTRGRVTVSGVPVGKHLARFEGLGRELMQNLEVRSGMTTNVVVNFATGTVRVSHVEGMPEGESEPAKADGAAGAEPAAAQLDARKHARKYGAFKHRFKRGLVAGGNPDGFQRAQADALRWLAVHQSPSGGWEAEQFHRYCDGKFVTDASRRPDGLGKARYDIGVTGLALSAFLAAGYTDHGEHPYAGVVARGLRFLVRNQDADGCFGAKLTQQYVYNHAAAAIAMVEAYGMTGAEPWRNSAQRALDFVELARNPYFAWRYGIKPGDNDTSVTGWMAMVIHLGNRINRAARAAKKPEPLRVDPKAMEGTLAWLQKVTYAGNGQVGYIQRGTGSARPKGLEKRFPEHMAEALTAAGIVARVMAGEDPTKSRLILLGANRCLKLPPRWHTTDGSIDMYYWYYGTIAMHQVGQKWWAQWKRAMQSAIQFRQRRDTSPCMFKGSWDPIGPWGLDGGRVYATALMALSLGVEARFERWSRR